MRIIAGEHRGRNLLPPPNDQTRPITDRAKQSLFDVLAPRITGARVADVFAGTGSMGLECLSRGAADATFFELGRGALDALRKNIEALRVSDRSKVIPGDLFKTFPLAFPAPALDIVFLDPPYAFLRERPEELRALAGALLRAIQPGGVISFRHDAADALELPGLAAARTLTYGSMTIELLAAT
jgi:16S rRNA (guanine966-N2)-methyltransferase